MRRIDINHVLNGVAMAFGFELEIDPDSPLLWFVSLVDFATIAFSIWNVL
jgi:hypothetical protein